MTDIYRKTVNTRFLPYNIGGHEVLAPEFLVEKHPRASWEVERFRSMEANLKPGDLLFDVGAEQGQQSAIYARFVGGGENMCLFEPTPQCWPNIRETWRANGLMTPRATFCGFVGDRTATADFHDFPVGQLEGWPACAYSDYLLDATKFRYLTEHSHATDVVALDDFVSKHDLRPVAITVDVEGFEIQVLRGALDTLRREAVLIWLSLHVGGNDIFSRDVPGDHVQEVYELMRELGYEGKLLGEDHERHVLFRKA